MTRDRLLISKMNVIELSELENVKQSQIVREFQQTLKIEMMEKLKTDK